MALFKRNNRNGFAFYHGDDCEMYKQRILNAKVKINEHRARITELKARLKLHCHDAVDSALRACDRRAYYRELTNLRVHECTVRTCSEIYRVTYNREYAKFLNGEIK